MAIRFISPTELATLMRAGKSGYRVIDVRGKLASLEVIEVSHKMSDYLPSNQTRTLKEEICKPAISANGLELRAPLLTRL